jgi:hypothetical protein
VGDKKLLENIKGGTTQKAATLKTEKEMVGNVTLRWFSRKDVRM